MSEQTNGRFTERKTCISALLCVEHWDSLFSIKPTPNVSGFRSKPSPEKWRPGAEPLLLQERGVVVGAGAEGLGAVPWSSLPHGAGSLSPPAGLPAAASASAGTLHLLQGLAWQRAVRDTCWPTDAFISFSVIVLVKQSRCQTQNPSSTSADLPTHFDELIFITAPTIVGENVLKKQNPAKTLDFLWSISYYVYAYRFLAVAFIQNHRMKKTKRL